jgi:dipeptidyl aminopeptidase/acylaminoacyl peptidase
MRLRARIIVFSVLAASCIAAAGGYMVYAAGRDAALVSGGGPVDEAGLAFVVREPYIVFRSTARNDGYGRVAVARFSDPTGRRVFTDLACDRVDMAGSMGSCLSVDNALGGTTVTIFDERFREVRELSAPGVPSRTRVSPDGSAAGYTSFVSGHSYAQGAFSTRTVIVDTASGDESGNLERFETFRDGERFDAPDFNFWGVTFTNDPDRFYATLGTGGETYLVEGDVPARRMEVVATGVECPSLSPDGTRIVFKKRLDTGFGPVRWGVAVMDLASGEVTELAEERNVDDQVAWLDDSTVMYGLPRDETRSPVTDVWSLAADGTGEPALLLEGAWSPRVVVP